MKKKSDNLLELYPVRNSKIAWSIFEEKVTLEIENKGIANKIAQVLLKKPKVSYIHLDEMGSFLWPLIDGKTNIFDLGKNVHEKFGDDANPLYERLCKYINTLISYGFIHLK